ncbi:MAG: SufD family Fe-S cluster assembly protein [Clostridium sp.]|nr:SufD family Fe-S cluster assembly protein [Acetatifactor muris]MCM1526862.1 SufD family Fe-S cluster assembly protein [Bacteroides sp.]MCM1562938.1 SufD family Fe-S cluster assembly protein [Clostridium sp.]
MDAIQQNLLEQVAGLHEIPAGAYNIRANGESVGRNTTANIDIVTKEDRQGIDILIRPGTRKESVHIPVVLSQSGLTEMVYNDFHVGDDCDVTIIAGCGIHNGGDSESRHDGIHSFYIGRNSHVKYVEKHYGSGNGKGGRVMNPQTVVELGENSFMEMETVQIRGVDSTKRSTTATLENGAKLVITERLMTHGSQYAESSFHVDLNGPGASANLISRAVARDDSKQVFLATINGNNQCAGHSECDAIIMDNATIRAIPEIAANHPDAALIHEAAIGKIAGDQITKLMTLGLTEAEAEEQIINGFLK